LEEHRKNHKINRGIQLDARFIQYVRYADDFIIGIVGPKQHALRIRDKIDTFLKSDLHLTVKKNTVVHRSEKKCEIFRIFD